MEKITQEKNIRGITLISLVVTIVVLIILSSVSINMVLGENGIIKESKRERAEKRATLIQGERDIWINERALAKSSGEPLKSMEAILQDLQDRGILTAEEVQTIKNDQNNCITIGGKTISFKIEEDL